MTRFSDGNPTGLRQMLETTPIFHRVSLMTVEDLKTRLQTELPEPIKQNSGFRQ